MLYVFHSGHSKSLYMYTVQHKLSTGIMNVLTTNGVDEYSLISF